MPLTLELPGSPADLATFCDALKALIAVNVSKKSIKLVTDAPTVVLTDDSCRLVTGNAICRYLLGSPSDVSTESIVEFEERAIYPLLLKGDPRVGLGYLNELVASAASVVQAQPVGAIQVILYASSYALSANIDDISAYPALSAWLDNLSALEPVANAVSALTANKPVPTVPQVRIDENVALPANPKEILPIPGQRNVLITSALPYVNNVPHLGNIIGSVLSADVYARYMKARRVNTLFVCGTDEYGTATETKALEEGVTPRQLCDKFNKIHKQVYDWFQIDFDYFGRTTTEQQTEIAQDIFTSLYKNDFMEEKPIVQLFCEKHQGFLADRFVEGTCPRCSYEDARGDQCDGCGNLLDPLELINPRCKIDNATPIPRESRHVFLRLDKLQPEVEEWSKKSSELGHWSRNGRIITESWLKEGLKPRGITRDLKWGTPVPLEGYENKVLYVWFDACIGYVSITANYTKKWQEWWRNPENVTLYQFMGKDNVPFHTVVFPASQIGTRQKWTMLHHIDTTEYLNYEGGKFSKSRNVGVFGNNAQDTNIPPSVWRYYLLASRPESADTIFSWKEFVSRNNTELLANLGNFVNRVIKFVNSKYQNVVPNYDMSKFEGYESAKKDVDSILASYNEQLDNCKIKQGLETMMHLSARGNQFLQEHKLDNSLFANHREKADAVVGFALNLIYLLSAVVYPYMPETSKKIVEQLNTPLRVIPDTLDLAIKPGHHISKAQYLFSRIDDAKVDEWRKKYGGGSSM
ncbi:hypothetical protein CANCADRAFT_106703 [Tortispora caseinolytica NRRL Y-17796]|uniref:methionine--tRNA ligase n=1 Tax=Tortispora caseinolytica NRRL Y-17796 TaxID=767744 RepID=A0A1E4TFJ2_9ASCO|nr:hypothetical protein CANCADRAFT_106703 [Tortispora caseinolytica NRRL Y-17796]